MRKSIMKWFMFLILMFIPLIVSAQYNDNRDNYNDWNSDQSPSYRNESGFSIRGVISSIDYGGQEIKVKTSQSRNITVYAANAGVYEGSRRRDIRNLRKGDRVIIFGREISNNTVEANTIYEITGNYPNDYRDYNDYNSNDRNTRAVGTIRSVDTRDREITISGDSRFDTVVLDSATKIYARTGKRLSLSQLRKGDDIKVAGARIRNNTIHAVDIYISINGSIWQPYGSPYDDYYGDGRDRDDDYYGGSRTGIRITAVITGFNTSTGQIKINKVGSYNRVLVNNNTKIYTRDGRRISLRNLDDGDSIRVVGYASKKNEITATEVRQQ
ncbi:MAG: DUF5666 domain-containing protein [Armatimonadota bacterium]